jgi:hypothetical protein
LLSIGPVFDVQAHRKSRWTLCNDCPGQANQFVFGKGFVQLIGQINGEGQKTALKLKQLLKPPHRARRLLKCRCEIAV